MSSASSVIARGGFIDTYSSVPVEQFDVDAAAAVPSPSTSEVVVSAVNLHKTYLLGIEGVPALRGVTVSVHRGEFVMILGTSGGGKTSLLNLFGTIDKPTKGDLTICGQRITAATTDDQFARLRLTKIGFVFQTFNLIPSMSALENVALPMVLEGRLSRAEIHERATALLTRVGLAARVDHVPSQLSGGEQQRVTIARAIANKPEVLLLDEPTGDLDTINGTIILGLLMQLNRHERMTCIMVTHDQSLKHYAHRVIHMVDGKILRLETIAPPLRQRADGELQYKLDAIKHKREDDANEPPPDGDRTEWRDPFASYPFLHKT